MSISCLQRAVDQHDAATTSRNMTIELIAIGRPSITRPSHDLVEQQERPDQRATLRPARSGTPSRPLRRADRLRHLGDRGMETRHADQRVRGDRDRLERSVAAKGPGVSVVWSTIAHPRSAPRKQNSATISSRRL